ncbi:MAG TPA: DUF3137 domain-containing protein [Williamwhitmania sp.]|jgi:hypothetical protein|nr:DUF3137 domain-containing protein [Williamwhitmania sp.]
MKSEVELQHFYEAEFKALLEPLEQYRLSNVRRVRLFSYLALASVIISGLCLLSELSFLVAIFIVPTFFFLGFAFQVLLKLSAHLTKQYKYGILPKLLGFLYEDYEYIARQKIAKSVLEKSMLMPSYLINVQGEDFMRFKMGNASIMFCEAKAQSNLEKVVFQGIFISASFNKNFTSKTFVLPKKFSAFREKVKINLLNSFSRVLLEDAEFNSKFNVYGSDQLEARYLLTPSLMQRIVEYERKTKKDISFSFVDNRLYCAIPQYTNLFEPTLFKPFNFEFVMENYTPLKLYTDLVEDLNLNLRIWSKE